MSGDRQRAAPLHAVTPIRFEKPDLNKLRNESDVEQKFIFPLLVSEPPFGFGIRSSYVLTKVDIRSFEIDKGGKRKLYYPDYVVAIGGFPLAVIEGKAPRIDLGEAYREARLYAAELNAIFPHNLNPVSVICATNGQETWIGQWDSATPALTLSFDQIEPYSPLMADAQQYLGFDSLRLRSAQLNSLQRPRRYFKPRRMIGGLAVQQEEVGQNSFGATMAAELGHIFNPVTRADRLRIAREGYVSSPRRERYVDPIDKVIRAAMPSWQANSTLINDPSQPSELLRPFVSQHRELEHRILLLIGERGSGKTTFLYHLQAVALPPEIRERTVWVHLDVNTAPVVKEEVYSWTRHEIVKGIQQAFPDIDFEDLDTIQKIYSVEVNKFNKGVGSLLTGLEKNYELYKELLRCQQDLDLTAKCYTRYFGSERGALIVVVFDNADKGPRDEQLLMFEVAQWLQREIRALMVLPIREETYDNYRGQPPLDTALKDLAFRIEPPVFQQALLRRVQIALNETAKQAEKNRTHELSNGFKITYAENERSYYLTSIAASIFEYDSYARRLVMGLAGNDLRRVFEIFVEFCTSGHINDGEILKMRHSKGEYVLPLHVVMTVLLRANRRYYDSDASVIKNILDLEDKDDRPSHFTRLLILGYLRSRFTEAGPNGIKGYVSLENIHEAISAYGIRYSMVKREVHYLARANCVATESMRVHTFEDHELFKLGPVGFVHLELLGTAEYWAAIAEDTNYVSQPLARRVADRIVVRDLHYSGGVGLQNGRAAFDYISQFWTTNSNDAASLLATSNFHDYADISLGDDALSRRSRTMSGGLWYEASERYPPGTEMEGQIVNVVDTLGLFVEIAPGLTGLLHKSRLPKGQVDPSRHQVGGMIHARIVAVEPERRRISLSLTSREKRLV